MSWVVGNSERCGTLRLAFARSWKEALRHSGGAEAGACAAACEAAALSYQSLAMMRTPAALIPWLVALAAVIGGILWHAGDLVGTTGAAPVGGPFALTDQNGERRTDKDFRGRFMLIYFGYSYCPDVCPTTLAEIGDALGQLGGNAKRIVPVFITIDPARDTKVLGEYLSGFHKSFVGLTGTPEEVRQVANAYKAFYAKLPPAPSGEYAIDHTGIIYLMGRGGEYLGFMPPQTEPQKLTEILRKYLSK